MKHEVKKISKILDELITFSFNHGTNKMHIEIEDHNEYFKIELQSNNIDCNDKRVNLLDDLLNCPRQPEIEEYYWELTGECDRDTELSLVGIMVDKAEVEFKGSALRITLYRYK